MIPIYFPFTYIPNYIAETIYKYFNKFVLYLPSELDVYDSINNLCLNKIIDIHFPAKGDENLLNSIITDLNNWGNIFLENGTDLLKTRLKTIPFFDNSFPSQIISEIKKSSVPKKNLLLNAKIFLHFAQNLDRQNYELDNEFNLLEKKKQNLLQNLTKNSLNDFIKEKNNNIKTDSFYDFMIEERLISWIYIALNNLNSSNFFLTHSKQLIDFLLNNFNEIENHSCIDLTCIKTKNNKTDKSAQLITYIESVAKNISYSETFISETYTDKKIKLTIYAVPDTTAQDFFSKIAGYNHNKKTEIINNKKYKNTILGLLEFNC